MDYGSLFEHVWISGLGADAVETLDIQEGR